MNELHNNTFQGFKPVVTKRASEVIYEQVKEMIVTGSLKPGNRLPSERNMMEMFARSRPTIREALRMLERSGYIRTTPGSNGAVVLEPNGENVQQTMQEALQVGNISLGEMSEYRIMSEVATVTWAVERHSADDIEALKLLLDKMRSSMNHYEEFVDFDSEFHALIAKAAKNKVSIAMNETLSKLNRQFVKGKMATLSAEDRKKMCDKIQEMHEKIYFAIYERDKKKAKLAMKEHLTAFGVDLR